MNRTIETFDGENVYFGGELTNELAATTVVAVKELDRNPFEQVERHLFTDLTGARFVRVAVATSLGSKQADLAYFPGDPQGILDQLLELEEEAREAAAA